MPGSRSSKPGFVYVYLRLIVIPIVGFCNCPMFCCALLYVHSSFAIILIGKRVGCSTLFVFLMSHDCCVALPRGANGLSSVFYCSIS